MGGDFTYLGQTLNSLFAIIFYVISLFVSICALYDLRQSKRIEQANEDEKNTESE